MSKYIESKHCKVACDFWKENPAAGESIDAMSMTPNFHACLIPIPSSSTKSRVLS